MDLPVRKNCPMGRLNSLAVTATATQLVELTNRQQLPQLLYWLGQQKQPPLVMGEGSNLVLASQLNMPVVLNRLKGIKVVAERGDRVLLEVAAGENWHELVTWCVNRSYHGLENLALIPGTVGAAPVQNIGAYGVELEQFVEAVEFLPFAASAHWMTTDECGFAYRDSRFKHDLRDSGIILSVRFSLSKRPRPRVDYPALRQALQDPDSATPRQVYDAVVAVRRSKLPDPQRVPNVGSFFHNPVLNKGQFDALTQRFPDAPGWPLENGQVKVPAAWLIEQQGWKGREAHGVQVSANHSLVLVNPNRRGAADVLALAGDIQQSVREAFDIELTIEPRVVGC